MMPLGDKPFKQYKNDTVDVVYDVAFDVYERSPFFCGYAYGADKIDKALCLLNDKKLFDLVHKEINLEWHDARILAESQEIEDTMKHSMRIAMLVTLVGQGEEITPVSIDTFSRSTSRLEGHHRLLALKFLGYSSFPAYLSGSMDELETFLNVDMSVES